MSGWNLFRKAGVEELELLVRTHATQATHPLESVYFLLF
jgi:hypothetical protein